MTRLISDVFSLRFPSIDDNVKEICSHKDDVISKIDVARAFRNLQVDPAYALKLGIIWSNDVYIDVAVAFDWVHRCAAFERVSDIVMFTMADADLRMFAYIDDYVIVSPRASGNGHFGVTFCRTWVAQQPKETHPPLLSKANLFRHPNCP